MIGYEGLNDAQKKQFDRLEGGAPHRFVIAMLVFGALSFIFMAIVCCWWRDLKLAVDVIDSSADFIAHNKRIIAVPNIYFIVTLVVTIAWYGSFLCVISLNEISADPIIPQNRLLTWDPQVRFMALFMVCGIVWITNWIEYTSRFVVIVSATTFYFSNHRDRADVEMPAEIKFGFECAYLYHAGSIAMGAFIIGTVKVLRGVFYHIAMKMKKAQGENGLIRCLVGCGTCILYYIEKICDYLNETAFCYMAVTGDAFLQSAWNGFLLNLKHGLKFAFAKVIAKFFIFNGKIAIVVTNCATLYSIMKARQDLDDVVNIQGPMLIVAIVTFMVASLFLSLFQEAVTAMLTCLCIDEDAHGGEPVYGPATFHDLYLGKRERIGSAMSGGATNQVE